MKEIKIQRARVHNLKNIDLTIPKEQLIVITGISGSGKSSLAFDILFEEGKNQYLKSIGILSDVADEERFDMISGIGPAVGVRQKTIRQNNPRSTIGTKTNILNQLALLYASDGKSLKDDKEQFFAGTFLYTTVTGMCPKCQGKGAYFDVNLEALIPNKKVLLSMVYNDLQVTPGFLRILKKKYGRYFEQMFWELPEDVFKEVVYGTYENGKQSYCLERLLKTAYEKGEDVEAVYAKTNCISCDGNRINEKARNICIDGKHMGELSRMTLTNLYQFLSKISKEELSQLGKNIIKDINMKLEYLIQFRLGYLTLYNEMGTLSGGEVQRLFLHLHLESKLDSLIYVFDEPMAGLHPSEKNSMIDALKKLRNLGNTVIVVEHDKKMIQQADYIIEIGPKAGEDGGEIVYQGKYDQYEKANTLLNQYIFNKCQMPKRTVKKHLFEHEDVLTLKHANTHYLNNLTVDFPLHAIVGIAGLSGSGKSSLIEDTLLKRLASAQKYGEVDGLVGKEKISGFVKISQDPIGRRASSTPASYIGIWDKIRELFAKQPESKNKNMSAGHFSFNSKGACQTCGGAGFERIFLTSDFSIDKICKDCQGKRYNEESLSITYNEKTIAEVLQMSISDAVLFFEKQNSIVKPLLVLNQMGMGYLTLGQPSISLSGGEAQRIKLAKELGKQLKGNMLYVLDEPTTGLSLYDTELLLKLLNQLVVSGNSVIVIEHNVEVLKNCDYIIELGPEGGDQGGNIIAKGTPEQLINNSNSKTGKFLVNI